MRHLARDLECGGNAAALALVATDRSKLTSGNDNANSLPLPYGRGSDAGSDTR